MSKITIIGTIITVLAFSSVLISNSYLSNEENSNTLKLFKEWVTTNNKKYATDAEFKMRFNNFKESLLHVQDLRKQGVTHKVDVGKYADFSQEEFKTQILGLNMGGQKKLDDLFKKMTQGKKMLKTAPLQEEKEFDWEKKGAMNPIRNQQACGSCYTFGAIASVEAYHYIKSGMKSEEKLQFSEQDVVDCSFNYGNYGCMGGDLVSTLRYIVNQGVTLRKDYPYAGRDEICRHDLSKARKDVVNSFEYASDDINAIKAVIKKSPAMIAVSAFGLNLGKYQSGIITDSFGVNCNGNAREMDHAVTLVGWGVEDGVEYWKIRNSWGVDFGEDGYFRVATKSLKGFKSGVCLVNHYIVRPYFK